MRAVSGIVSAVLAVIAVCASPCAATAEEPAPDEVILVLTVRGDPLGEQLIDELFAEGFRVAVVNPSGDPSEPIREYADWRDARVMVVATPGSVEPTVYTFHPVRGMQDHRLLPAPLPSAEPRVVALRVVELIRQTLRDLDRPPEEESSALANIPGVREGGEGPASVHPPGANPPPVDEQSALLRVGVMGAARLSEGELGTTGHLEGHLSAAVWSRLRVWLGVLVPLHATRVREPEGVADIWTAQLSAGASWGVLPLVGPWQWTLGLGGGAGVTWYDASTGDAGLIGKADSLVSPMVEGRSMVSYRINRWVGLSVTVAVGALIPRHQIIFVNRPVASWGKTWGWVGLGVDGLVP